MYKIILALRYLLKRRITYFAVLAVGLCVFIVVIVMTVMTGLVRDFKQKNHDFVGDCVVGTESLVGFAYYEDFMKILQEADFIKTVSPVVRGYALVNPRRTEQNIGLEVMGIYPVRHSQATGFRDTLYYHKNDVSRVFEPIEDPNIWGCVVGIDRVLVRDAKGHYAYSLAPANIELTVSCFPLTAKGALAKAGTGLVNTRTFYLNDHSQTGLARVDSSVIYLPFEQAQLLCGMSGPIKRVSSLHIKFKPGVKLWVGCEKVRSMWREFTRQKAGESQAHLFETVAVQNWKDYRRGFIAAMEKEQTIMIVMFAFVGLTTVFIVFVVFYMIISHKSKDIGILKSMGVSNLDVIELFSGFAFSVGLLGSCIGTLAGWLFLLQINRIENWLFENFQFQLWDRTIYAIGDIPNRVTFEVLAVIVFSAVMACLAGALVPSWQAAKLEPVEALRVSLL
jgi:lipoprotein-releasing system permease protein